MGCFEIGGYLSPTKEDLEFEDKRNYDAGYNYNKGKQQAKAEYRKEKKAQQDKNELMELEAKLQFLKAHSNDPKDLELAKMVLGIK